MRIIKDGTKVEIRYNLSLKVRGEGVEPSYLAAQASETCVSAIPPPPHKDSKYNLGLPGCQLLDNLGVFNVF